MDFLCCNIKNKHHFIINCHMTIQNKINADYIFAEKLRTSNKNNVQIKILFRIDAQAHN